MKMSLSLAFTALVFLEAFTVVFSQARFSNETDMRALLEFKSQVAENKRDVLVSWNNSTPLCNWIGVTCGRKQERVIGLDLGGFKLGGVVSSSIGNLSFLRSLNLGDNSLGSTIPQEVGRLFRLQYLNMSLNLLQGRIPLSLSNCSRLSTLDLSSNQLGHRVPSELGSLSKLVILYLNKNNLTGKFPGSLGNLTSLQELDFGTNNMEGEIPDDVARLTQMVFFQVSLNSFSGVFPPALYNMSLLETLSLADNSFSGNIEDDFGDHLPNLRTLVLGANQFTGVIPVTVTNISSLEMFDISNNYLAGSISSFGKLPNLWWLGIRNNSLGSNSASDLEFIGALVNCTQLEFLDAGYNRLGGELPTSTANLSTKLTRLDLGANFISGAIPWDIGNLISLQLLSLEENKLTGRLPVSFGKLLELQELHLYSNALSGELPSYFGNMTRLQRLHLNNNSFQGRIPQNIGRSRYLLELWIDTNRLNESIPKEIFEIPSLTSIDLSSNFLTGPFPEEIGKMESLVGLSAEYNRLSGQIPQTIGRCLSLEFLYMQGNSFEGAIPDIRRLVSLKKVDFSNNNLSGHIPRYLANFTMLESLNLSMNKFEGRMPTTGVFRNTTVVSVFGNKNLCGGSREMQLNPCTAQASPRLRKPLSRRKKIASGIGIGIASLLLVIIVASLCWYKKKRKKKNDARGSNPSDSNTLGMFYEKVSYEELYNATSGFSSSNLIGSGNFGEVFKGLLGLENKLVAVKVLNLLKHGAAKSFMAECETFKGIRHRNLVKLITVCSSLDSKGNDFRALVYEFMPKGSLDVWLQPEDLERANDESRSLTLPEKLNIAIDVASALEYLHVHCHDPVAHCDLKPSNVLLDDDLTAHVGDFGLARLLYTLDRESFLNKFSSAGVRGTIGYAAPEYGMGGQPSIRGDVYSFGILLLEMFTGKKPTDESFAGDYDLHSYTKSVLLGDEKEGSTRSEGSNATDEWLRLVLQVGIKCSEVYPGDRMRIAEALRELISIRSKFLGSKTTVTKLSLRDAQQSSPQEWMLSADVHTI